MGAAAIVEALARLDELAPEVQPEEGVTYAAKIDKAEAQVDWSAPAVEVDRKIRGLSPFPGAWCEIEGQRVKLLASRLAEGSGVAGEVLDDALTVACGTGAVQLLRLQRAGKGAQDADVFLRGFPVIKGAQL
jgi:methionyl-tRNA formyltransferase